MRRGAARLAYPPVVASGVSNLILHYIQNDSVLCPGDLILMDAGGEYNNYASDLTRTWPVNGKFTEAQLAVYNIVLETQQKCIQACVPDGKISLKILQGNSMRLLAQGLMKLGLLKSLNFEELKQFYPHSIGHYLGMDTHDVPTCKTDIPLQSGMIVTVEPGLYIPVSDTIPKEFRGIGIRIEDDIYVSENAPEVLTREAPKEPLEIEALAFSGTKH